MSREAGPQWVGAGQTVLWGRGGKLCPRHEPSGIVGSPRLRHPEGTQAAPAWNPAPRSSGAGGPSSRWCQQRGAQSSHRAGPGPGSQTTSHPGTHGSFTPARVSFGPTEMEMSLSAGSPRTGRELSLGWASGGAGSYIRQTWGIVPQCAQCSRGAEREGLGLNPVEGPRRGWKGAMCPAAVGMSQDGKSRWEFQVREVTWKWSRGWSRPLLGLVWFLS